MSFIFVLKPGKGTPRGQCLFTLVMGVLCYIETYLQKKVVECHSIQFFQFHPGSNTKQSPVTVFYPVLFECSILSIVYIYNLDTFS